MISEIQNRSQSPAWQRRYASAFTRLDELLRYLRLNPSDFVDPPDPHQAFPVRVPRDYAARIEKGNPRDPLLLQILPLRLENVLNSTYSPDPTGDQVAMVTPGLLKKYRSRALLVATGACAIHCRYCFRREYPYQEASAAVSNWPEILQTITADTELEEIILSGGDPLSLSDERLSTIITQLAAVPRIKRIRIHTRLPVVIPARVTPALLDMLSRAGKNIVLVTHINHAHEIDTDVVKAMRELQRAGVILLNQSVLLKQVNDSVKALIELSEHLLDCGISPYYLHQLDRIQGAAHFEVADAVATNLVREMRNRCAGYMVPRLVREMPGLKTKVPVELLRSEPGNIPPA